jgi:hypothetical protein
MSLSDYQREINDINNRVNGITVTTSTASSDVSEYVIMGYFMFGFFMLLIVLVILLIRNQGSSGSTLPD